MTPSVEVLVLVATIGAGLTALMAGGMSFWAKTRPRPPGASAEQMDYIWSATRNAWLTPGGMQKMSIAPHVLYQPKAVLDQLATGLPRAAVERFDVQHTDLNRSPEDRTTLRGADQIVSAGVRLLNSLSTKDADPARPHVILAQMGVSMFEDRVQDRQADWDAAMERVLKAGHPITHIVPAPDPAASNRLLDWIVRIVKFAKNPGHYELFLVPTPSENPLPVNLVLVPGIGSLISFTSPDPASDIALVVTDRDQVPGLLDVAKRLLHGREPVLTQVANREQFEDVLSSAEREEGPRFLVKAGLSDLQIPPHIRLDWKRRELEALSESWSEADFHIYAEHLLSRQRAFEAQIEEFEFREVCSLGALREFLQHQRLPRDDVDYTVRDKVLASEEQCREVARFVLDRLQRFPRYQLALDDKDSPTIFWEVKGDYVLAEDFSDQPTTDRRNVVIRSPHISRTFEDDFLTRVWRAIPPERRENKAVAQWLQEQVMVPVPD